MAGRRPYPVGRLVGYLFVKKLDPAGIDVNRKPMLNGLIRCSGADVAEAGPVGGPDVKMKRVAKMHLHASSGGIAELCGSWRGHGGSLRQV